MSSSRPVTSWIIAAVFALNAAQMTVSYLRGYALVRGHRIEMPRSQVERAARAAVLGLGCAGAVQLLRRRTSAVSLFLAGTLADSALVIWDLLRSASSRHIGILLVTSLMSVAIWAACFVYAL